MIYRHHPWYIWDETYGSLEKGIRCQENKNKMTLKGHVQIGDPTYFL